jgi:hypothetical protein
MLTIFTSKHRNWRQFFIFPFLALSYFLFVIPRYEARTVGCAGFGLLEGMEDEMDEESCKEFVRRMGLPFLPRNGHFRDSRPVSFPIIYVVSMRARAIICNRRLIYYS